jgi:hypothetical protein
VAAFKARFGGEVTAAAADAEAEKGKGKKKGKKGNNPRFALKPRIVPPCCTPLCSCFEAMFKVVMLQLMMIHMYRCSSVPNILSHMASHMASHV